MLAHSRYHQTQTETASTERILVLLLQKARRVMALADEELTAKRPRDAAPHLQRAFEIVAELCDSLDATKAPALADNLGAVYGFIMQRLIVAQRGDTAAQGALRQAQRAFAPIADAFEQAVAAVAR